MGDVANLTVEILAQIRDGVLETNRRLEGLTARVDHLTERVDRLAARVDNLIDLSGKAWRDLERRVRKLEKHVGMS